MYLPAITIGYVVPAVDFDASVHSVFHSALNLRQPDSASLLTLVLSSEPDLPQGIRLDAPEDFSFEAFQVGEHAIRRDGFLHFESSHLVIQLGNARRWECDLPKLEIDIGNPAVSTAWSLVWEALNKRQRRLNAEIIAGDMLHTGKIIHLSTGVEIPDDQKPVVTLTLTDENDIPIALETLEGYGFTIAQVQKDEATKLTHYQSLLVRDVEGKPYDRNGETSQPVMVS